MIPCFSCKNVITSLHCSARRTFDATSTTSYTTEEHEAHYPRSLPPVVPELILAHLCSLTPVGVCSEIVEALAGNPVDPSNIIESRTRRKNSVDYVKLNQTVFG